MKTKIIIDPRIEALFPGRDWLEKEMTLHGVEAFQSSIATVGVKGFSERFEIDLCAQTNSPMITLPKFKVIYLDLLADWEIVRKRLNWPQGDILKIQCRYYSYPVILQTEQEARLFIFWHECRHIQDPTLPEWQCDKYARDRILERRKNER
jgi:hypothetical protein